MRQRLPNSLDIRATAERLAVAQTASSSTPFSVPPPQANGLTAEKTMTSSHGSASKRGVRLAQEHFATHLQQTETHAPRVAQPSHSTISRPVLAVPARDRQQRRAGFKGLTLAPPQMQTRNGVAQRFVVSHSRRHAPQPISVAQAVR